MAWDDDQATGDEYTASIFNDLVAYVKGHAQEHGYEGDDELATALKYDPQAEPATPTDGCVRWYDSTEDAYKVKFDDGTSVTVAER